jgi:hypothetical protein
LVQSITTSASFAEKAVIAAPATCLELLVSVAPGIKIKALREIKWVGLGVIPT